MLAPGQAIRRDLEGPLLEAAAQMPVVAVTGPRQSGKSTLCRRAFPDRPYVSLEPLDVREYAAGDPRGFLAEHADGVILDEIQRVPALFSYLQEEVDQRPEPGRFVLTGSQSFELGEAITQSLAGRIALLHLLPPSLGELERFGHEPVDLWTQVWTGAYPRIYHRDLDPARWLTDYAATYVERDVRQVLEIRNLTVFRRFMELLAGHTGGEMNLSDLGGDVGVTHPTVRSWLSVLEASFLCVSLPAWHRNLKKRVVKRPKVHLIDTGLACHLLGIVEPDQLRRHPLRGRLFESWVVSEVLKARLHRGDPARLFHLRQTRGPEIDLIVEAGERLIPVEVKSAATVASDFFRHLESLRRELEAADRTVRERWSFEPRLVYGGERRQNRTQATVLPWRSIQAVDW